jgi:hypothetical protein
MAGRLLEPYFLDAPKPKPLRGPEPFVGPGEELVLAVALLLWHGESRGDPVPLPEPVPTPDRDPKRNLTPRHDSAAARRGLFGARPGPPMGGYEVV